jgi:hypothetical protein
MLTPVQDFGFRYIGWETVVCISLAPLYVLYKTKKIDKATAGEYGLNVMVAVTIAWVAFNYLNPALSGYVSWYLVILPPTLVVSAFGH